MLPGADVNACRMVIQMLQVFWELWRSLPGWLLLLHPDHGIGVVRMKHRLQTSTGKKVYAQRKVTSEPVFGIIKAVMGFRSFLLRGLDAAAGEWNLVCMAYNIKKLHTSTR